MVKDLCDSSVGGGDSVFTARYGLNFYIKFSLRNLFSKLCALTLNRNQNSTSLISSHSSTHIHCLQLQATAAGKRHLLSSGMLLSVD